MPAFTFEKIPAPQAPGPEPVAEIKHRGVIDRILDRFVESRVKRAMRQEKRVMRRGASKPS